MIRHALIVVAIVLAAGMCHCNAFSSDNTPFEGFNEKDIPAMPGLVAGAHEGIYEGTMTLMRSEETCPGVTDAQGETSDVVFDVIHSGDFISIVFEDATEEHGKMVDGKVSLVKRSAEHVRMYHLEFIDGGQMTGVCDVLPIVDGDIGAEPCAEYEIACTCGE